MRIEVPKKVEYIIQRLMEHGHEAYAVGGCVRDSILGRIPGDWDITTSASPNEVKEIFHRTIDTGIQHGTVTVMIEKDGFEVTTYRLDGEYEDCRHPKNVEFTKSLEEDLKRRDFTINAMAYNKEEGIVDLFEGMEDIKRRCIRCVGTARDRFEEDALRILRAIRFSAQLNFTIEEATKEAIEEKAKNLSNISAERIRVELNKLFLSKFPEKLQIAYETGITAVVLPEFDHKVAVRIGNGEYETTVSNYTLDVLKAVSKVANSEIVLFDCSKKEQELRTLTEKEHLCLSYASLLWNPKNPSDEDMLKAKQVMQRLKFDNETIGVVTKLVNYSHTRIQPNPVSVRKAMNEMGVELMDLWFLFQRINQNLLESIHQVKTLDELERCYEIFCEVMQSKQCVCLKELAVNGRDLIQLGCEPGVGLGATLAELLEMVLVDPSKNTKDILLEIVNLKKTYEPL